MIECKAKQNGVDLIIMENTLGKIPNISSMACQVNNQSDINASKRIKRLT